MSTPSSSPSNLTQLSIFKLTRDNYPLWCTVIVPFLERHNFYGYVTGDSPCPPEFVPPFSSMSLSAVKIKNPEYLNWYQQDKLIMSALISSLSENLLAHVFGLKTSREVWVTLEKMFASQSKARVLQNRLQLTSLKKGALSIADYFQKA